MATAAVALTFFGGTYNYTSAPLVLALGHLHAPPQPHRRRPYRETSLTLAALAGYNRTTPLRRSYLLLDTFTLHRNRTAAGRTPRSWTTKPHRLRDCTPAGTTAGQSQPCALRPPLLGTTTTTSPSSWLQPYYTSAPLVPALGHLHAPRLPHRRRPYSTTTSAPLVLAPGHLHAPRQPHRRRPYRETSLTLAALTGNNRTLRAGTCTLATSRSSPTAPPPTVPSVWLHLGHSHLFRTPCRWYFALDDLTLHGNRAAAAGHYLPHHWLRYLPGGLQPRLSTQRPTVPPVLPVRTRAMTPRDSSCRWPRAWIPETSVRGRTDTVP